MDKGNSKINIWLPLGLSVMLAAGMILGYTMNNQDESPLIHKLSKEFGPPSSYGQVEELIRFVESRYVDSLDRDVLVEKSIKTILKELDPHSIYISPDQLADINDDMKGSFTGIGIEVYYLEDTVNIIRVLPDGPADKAGLKAYDKIININDSLVAGNEEIEYTDIRDMLRGQLNEKLTINILRLGSEEIIPVEVIIDDITVNSVEVGFLSENMTGYIKVNKFSSNTYKEFMEYFEEFHESGMKNLIIDLRGNPGGYLPEATNILSQLFTEEKRMLVYTEGKNDRKHEYKTTGKPFFAVDKIAVLIDENSASGSEIIAGAIQDWDRGIIIGRRTFGKGLVQEQYELSNGGALRLTVARYFTPSGRSIQRTYSDIDNYYNDYIERYTSGELFERDTTHADSVKIYKTLTLNRNVYGGGGISPDVFISADSLNYDPKYIDIMNVLPQIVFRQIGSHNDYNNLEIQEEIYDIIDEKHGIPFYMKEMISNQILINIIKHKEGLQAMYKYIIENEHEFEIAMDYFNGNISLKPTLAKNEGM